MTLAFQGASLALSSDGLAHAMDRLSVDAAAIWTVLQVETRGSGYLPDRRPSILFERHIFSRLTNRQFDISDVSNPQPGGYGAGGAHQYDRLSDAVGKDRAAAIKSASWGMAQIMGENYASAGFSDVETMVAAMSHSEDGHLAAFASFLQSNGLDRHLQAKDWTSLARGYNGSNYAINQYDTKLAAAFTRLSAGPLPDLNVRTAQLYLTFAGFNPGSVDGVMGPNTRNALLSYQQRNGLPQTGAADDQTLASLLPSVPE
jgi:hypothetical protein